MNYFVVSPKADGQDSEKFLKEIKSRHIALMGWDVDHQLGRKFAELQIGDRIIIASGSNANKRVYALGVVDTHVRSSEIATQEVHMFNFIDDAKLIEQVKFSNENAYGNSSQIPAIYELKDYNDADKTIMKTIDEIIKRKSMIDFLKANKNIILHGAPGTGKTYLARKIASDMGASWDFVQFHPSYDYTDFVEGLRPFKVEGQQEIGFKRKDGIFKEFCKKALADPGHDYVFIIDEINRGELSKIFGELFYALDPGYRGVKGHVKTQYQNLVNEEINEKGELDRFSGEGFYVPENVYIIGTMNDIDRSVETMDFAMRRRFASKEITAEASKDMLTEDSFKKISEGNAEIAYANVNEIKNRMDSLNKAILDPACELSTDYQIGGAYFLKYALYANEENAFEQLWINHLETILKEYLRGNDPDGTKLDILRKAYNNQ